MSEPDITEDGYDNTPEGRELVALLRQHAPPAVDPAAGRQSVMARIGKPRGRMLWLNWLPPLVGAAAAVALAFVIFSPKPGQQANHPPAIAKDNREPAETPLEVRHDHGYPEIVAVVRGDSAEGLLVDAGLKDGLRVGDELRGTGGIRARVTAVGVFDARVSVTGGKPAKGAELRAAVQTDAQLRAAKYSEFGGDPGAFLEFGALVSAMPLSEARMLGISDGAAIRVDEAIPAIMKDPGAAPEVTLAARLDLRPGDVIIEANGSHIRNVGDFGNALGWSLDPKLLNLRVLRNGRQLDLKLR